MISEAAKQRLHPALRGSRVEEEHRSRWPKWRFFQTDVAPYDTEKGDGCGSGGRSCIRVIVLSANNQQEAISQKGCTADTNTPLLRSPQELMSAPIARAGKGAARA